MTHVSFPVGVVLFATAAALISGNACFGETSSQRGEVAGFGGGLNLRAEGQGVTKPIYGGRVGSAISDRLFVFGEVGYAPLANFAGTVSQLSGVTSANIKARLFDVAGGVHVNLVGGGAKAVPYVIGAAGIGMVSASGSATVNRNTVSLDASDTSVGVGGGFGLRYFVGSNWGIQPEFRYVRYMSGGDALNGFRFTGGVFYRFGGK